MLSKCKDDYRNDEIDLAQDKIQKSWKFDLDRLMTFGKKLIENFELITSSLTL